jgi:hypothetical protein
MSVTRIAGIFDAIIALLTGYLGLQMMFASSSGGSFFWWPLTTFGASTLLLVNGIGVVFPLIKKEWLVALAGIILVVTWATLVHDFSWTYCIFVATVVSITWATLALSLALKRPGVAPLLASVILAAAWLPGSVIAFRDYLFPNPPSRNPPVLLPLLVLWGLIIVALAIGAVLFRSSRTRGLMQPGAPLTTTTD